MCNYQEIFLNVLKKHGNHKKWDNAVYKDIKIISNTKVGSVGQDFIEDICKSLNMSVKFPLNKKKKRAAQSPWDLKIDGISFELKTATEDVGGCFQFNHIRYHREYEAVLCLGVAPNDLYFNVWSKADITTGKAGKLVTMEKGANASYKLTKTKDQLKKCEEFYSIMNDFRNRYMSVKG